VGALYGATGPTGTVSLIDSTNASYGLAAPQLGSATNGFLAPILQSSQQSNSIAVGDFNGDGILDVAVENGYDSSLEIYLGNGNGTFTQTAYMYPTTGDSGYNNTLVAADFNGDGKLDLALADGGTHVVIFTGNGDGTFTQAASTAVGASTLSALVVADFNGDGIPDLAVVSYNNSAMILLGSGSGTFTLKSTLAVTYNAYAGAIAADFNGDGIPDLAVPSYNPTTYLGAMNVYLGKGDGTFTAGTAIPTQGVYTTPVAIQTADLNGDGIADIVLVSSNDSTKYSLQTYLGNGSGGVGNGTFTLAYATNGGNGTYTEVPVVADFNGDGIDDIAVVTGSTPWQSQIYIGKGDGTFTLGSATPIPAIGNSATSAVGDFNGDGYLDYLVGSESPKVFGVLLQGNASPFSVSGISVPGHGSHSVFASYAGDGTNSTSQSSTITLTATTVSTNSSVTVTPTTVAPGSPASISAQISPVAVGGLVPSGSVQFKDGATSIGSSTLSGGQASISYSFSTLGVHSITAVYAGDTNFKTSTSSVATVMVGQQTPTITWAAPTSIGYGTALSGAQLNATASTPGTFSYTPALGTVLTAGVQTLSVTFTPTDTTDYSSATDSVQLTVTQATSVVTAWPTASSIVHGQSLSSSTLSAGSASPAGLFVFTAPTTTPATGSSSQSVTFTPTDATDYSTVSGSVNVMVNKATPAIGSWPTASAISYGQSLVSSTLSGGSATFGGSSLPGTFAFTTPSTTPTAGTYSASVTFTPTDSTDFNTVTNTINVTVNQVTPTVSWATPGAITYGTALSSLQLNATASVPGSFVYNPPAGTVLNAGSVSLSVTFTPTDSTDYITQTSSVILTINAATPQVVWSAPQTMLVGSLDSTVLNANSAVPGTFAYNPPAGTQLLAGVHNLSVVFSPSNPNYVPVNQIKSIQVQIKPSLVWANPASVAAGSKLWAAQLNATANLPGTFVYNPPAGTTLVAGTQILSTTFTPTDNVTYATTTTTVPIVVSQTVPVLTWITPANIAYGTALWGQQLSASSSVPGTFVYNPAAGTVLQPGSQVLTATFTPTDAVNYAGGVVTSTLIVTPANPVISWQGLAAVPLGTTLSATQLNATASVAGSFVYSPALGTALATAGTQTLSTTFTPTDTVHYASVIATTTIAVTSSIVPIVKSTPVVTWSTPAAIAAGTALSSTQLNATASVPGTFTYSPTIGTVLSAGTQPLIVSFTPSDPTHYNVAGAVVMMTVNAAAPTPKVTWNQPAAITYGSALWAGQLNASANMAGTFVYTPAAGTVLQPGTQQLSVTFTPSNSAFAPVTASVPLLVNQIASLLKWNTPATMTSGTALWAMQLDANASVPGTFTYTPAAGTVLTTGTYTLSATFLPSDPIHYGGGTISTTLTVK
jgi:hypothetical protein